MATTGKKFIIALLALSLLLGLGWWLLKPEPPVSGTVSGTVPDTVPDTQPASLQEIAIALQLVSDSLAIGKDTQPALEMMKTLEARLAVAPSPARTDELRQALALDRQRIAQAPKPDIAAMQSVLKRLQAALDSLPNVFVPQSGAAGTTVPAGNGPASQPPIAGYWSRMTNALSEKISEVVKVRRVEDRQSAYRTPEQGRLLNEQLRLRIELAQEALQMRNAPMFSKALVQALAILDQAFDTDHSEVIAVREALRDLQGRSAGLAPLAPDASIAALNRLRSEASQ